MMKTYGQLMMTGIMMIVIHQILVEQMKQNLLEVDEAFKNIQGELRNNVDSAQRGMISPFLFYLPILGNPPFTRRMDPSLLYSFTPLKLFSHNTKSLINNRHRYRLSIDSRQNQSVGKRKKNEKKKLNLQLYQSITTFKTINNHKYGGNVFYASIGLKRKQES